MFRNHIRLRRRHFTRTNILNITLGHNLCKHIHNLTDNGLNQSLYLLRRHVFKCYIHCRQHVGNGLEHLNRQRPHHRKILNRTEYHLQIKRIKLYGLKSRHTKRQSRGKLRYNELLCWRKRLELRRLSHLTHRAHELHQTIYRHSLRSERYHHRSGFACGNYREKPQHTERLQNSRIRVQRSANR